ncbi:MAG: DNA repair protein RadC [Corallococcus sp.]|nr:DNA repair protein RadC [Bacillota bacterium]MCM1533200.1 DNA repair protein RadC [Corallococcus sp.]
MAGVNDGHRNRLRERMINEGLSGFQDHEILELLLFQYLPRQDTNKLAHRLIERFGSFGNVLNASPEQLMSVQGVSKVTACNLAMLKEVWRRYKAEETNRITLDKLTSILQYSRALVAESYVERMVVVYVDGGTNFLFREEFDSSDAQTVVIDPKKIVFSAVRVNASGIILFHCHTQGNCKPSAQDVSFTERLIFSLAGLDVVVMEHIIFNARGEYFSFYREGLIDEIASKFKKTIN